jgi:nucleotide-binding universal stress UspA family protein
MRENSESEVWGDAMKKIVVGVDGSMPSQAALEFAAEEAALRGARLEVVSAWDIPQAAIVVAGANPGMIDSFREGARTIAERAATRARELHPTIVCKAKAIEGHPASVLLEEARAADLIVVGNRGSGGFARMLLGSVSDEVVHHSSRSVVVVRAQPDFEKWA